MTQFGYQSMVAPIRRLLLKHPKQAFISQAHIGRQWKDLNYFSCPDLSRTMEEYDRFVDLFREFDIEMKSMTSRWSS